MLTSLSDQITRKELHAYYLEAELNGTDPQNIFKVDGIPQPRMWRFKLVESLISLRRGLILLGAKPHGTTDWETNIISLPKEVIEQIGAVQHAGRWYCPNWKTVAEMEEQGLYFTRPGKAYASLAFMIMIPLQLHPTRKQMYVRAAARRALIRLRQDGELEVNRVSEILQGTPLQGTPA